MPSTVKKRVATKKARTKSKAAAVPAARRVAPGKGAAKERAAKKRSFRHGPLSGIRIVDLTNVVMGPFATHILADMGADVIKVEAPEGDLMRKYKPMRNPGMSGNILNLHRNKRCIVLDLKNAVHRGALDRLIATADVFVHALRPRTIAALGYAYSRVRKLKPDIIYCGAYGFGAKGPYGDKAAYDDLIQAGGGLASLAERVTGTAAYVPSVICDKLTGQAIAYAILAGIVQRQNGGGGQVIEVPMFETSVEFMLVEHMSGFTFKPPLGRAGFTRILERSRKPYRTKDGFACILPYSDRNWVDFFDFTGRTEFKGDPRYAKLADRVPNIDVLYRMIAAEAPKRTTAEWVRFCDSVSIPCMPVLGLEELPDDAHLKAVGMFQPTQHPSEGEYLDVRRAVSFGNAAYKTRRPAARLGEHTAQVLAEIGMSKKEIAGIVS